MQLDVLSAEQEASRVVQAKGDVWRQMKEGRRRYIECRQSQVRVLRH